MLDVHGGAECGREGRGVREESEPSLVVRNKHDMHRQRLRPGVDTR